MARDARRAFVERVKAIDPIFKRGDLQSFWPALEELVALAPERVDVSRKKSHYLASLAARSLARDDPASALEFLDLADATVEASHMTPFLLEERMAFRQEAIDLSRRLKAGSDSGHS
jgi:hypothetical protein